MPIVSSLHSHVTLAQSFQSASLPLAGILRLGRMTQYVSFGNSILMVREAGAHLAHRSKTSSPGAFIAVLQATSQMSLTLRGVQTVKIHT